MAERRMFAKKVVQSSKFFKMPVSTRELYFQLGMAADDDGVVEAWNVMKLTNAHEDDLRILVGKGYITILNNEDLVAYLNDWETNNVIRSDRYHKGIYKDLKIRVLEAQPVLSIANDNQMSTKCQPNDNQCETEVRLGKNSIGKDSINNNILSGKKSDNEKKNTFSEEISKIINYLNDVLGTRYTTKSKSTNSMIKGRLEEGHTVDDFIKVIDNKHKEWGEDPKMVKYLRPETLFRASHFESYLNEIKPKEADLSKHYYQPPEFVPQTEEEKRRSQEWWDSLEEDEDV